MDFPIRTTPLRAGRHGSDYFLYKAALEWSLEDPIVINGEEDLRSEPSWRNRVDPYHHQITNLITFCRRLPVTLLADDVGLGKTISAGLIASELMARKRLSRVLIVCPKLLGPQWKEELETKFDIQADVVTGQELLKAEPDSERSAVITTYNTARLYLERIPEDRFQMLVLDEAHKLRNLFGVAQTPMVAKVFQKVLAERFFKYVLMLTATPIQNRLWDLYSLVDLLTTAKGHKNPFGTPGLFARRFIADAATDARHLVSEVRDEFRSVIYSYMSRIRRGDANLVFPDRRVLLHRTPPTDAEVALLELLRKPLQKMNRLTQIGLLQALTSSPHALSAQLKNMARNGTAPVDLAASVKSVVDKMSTSAKLDGLAALVDRIRAERPNDWRMVIFTGRRETQTTIENYLLSQGITVGTINGTSGARNQETLTKFRLAKPKINVIVSTEAGAEGVNLQVANVLVNYDLPWNPMIVEQRIGRIQRLGSEHKTVSIYNIVLSGTFEEYIVARLLEKLQMASHAIGDIESLLEAANLDGDEDSTADFEEQIRKLVLDSLAGRDVERSIQQAEESIAKAKQTLEEEERTINSLLGDMGEAGVTGPRTPSLPISERSLDAESFVVKALEQFGSTLQKRAPGHYRAVVERRQELIVAGDSEPPSDEPFVDYRPGRVAFDRLVGRLTSAPLHSVSASELSSNVRAHRLARQWVLNFSGRPVASDTVSTSVSFDGTALVRTRATVAHDSYERLIEVRRFPSEHSTSVKGASNEQIDLTNGDVSQIGLTVEKLRQDVLRDEGVSKFCDFYLQRRADEVRAALGDERKEKKLNDEFTPRLEATVVGLDGEVLREYEVEVVYSLRSDFTYKSRILIAPNDDTPIPPPEFGLCRESGLTVPSDCLAQCAVTGITCLLEYLDASEQSGRLGLRNKVVRCSVTGKKVLEDEVSRSDVTGQLLLTELLKTSPISGKKAEPKEFGRCEFSNTEVLLSELGTSEVSGRRYRIDQVSQSEQSGLTGHRSEFFSCPVTHRTLLRSEGVACAVSGTLVASGALQKCEISGRAVLPEYLEQCAVSGKRVLPEFLVQSSMSAARFIPEYGVAATSGRVCMPAECGVCIWSGERWHPEDLRLCSVTSLPVHVDYTTGDPAVLVAIYDLKKGMLHASDASSSWPTIGDQLSRATGSKQCTVLSAALSPSGRHLACFAEVRTLLGLKRIHAVFVYSFDRRAIIGTIAKGKRSGLSWKAIR